jgi:hypothetical protein
MAGVWVYYELRIGDVLSERERIHGKDSRSYDGHLSSVRKEVVILRKARV